MDLPIERLLRDFDKDRVNNRKPPGRDEGLGLLQLVLVADVK